MPRKHISSASEVAAYFNTSGEVSHDLHSVEEKQQQYHNLTNISGDEYDPSWYSSDVLNSTSNVTTTPNSARRHTSVQDPTCNSSPGCSKTQNSTTSQPAHYSTPHASTSQSSPNEFMETVQTLTKEIKSKNNRISELERELEDAKKIIDDYKQRDKPKQRIDNSLSLIVKKLYASLDTTEKFVTTDPYASEGNNIVKKKLVAIIASDHPRFQEQEIYQALHSRYTLERRRTNRDKTEAEQYNRRIARKHSTLETRIRVAKERRIHENIIKSLHANDMSDYQSDETSDTLLCFPPAGRAAEITAAIREIDAMAKYRKGRKISTPSKRRRINNV